MFGEKVVAQAGRLPDAKLLSLAAGRGAMHVYVMVDGTGECGGTAALAECAAALEGLGLCDNPNPNPNRSLTLTLTLAAALEGLGLCDNPNPNPNRFP